LFFSVWLAKGTSAKGSLRPARPRGAAGPGRTAGRTRPADTACRRAGVVDDRHLVGDRLGEQRPILEVVGVDVVGRVELVAGAPHDDLPAELDVEARARSRDRHVGGVALDVEAVHHLHRREVVELRAWLVPIKTGSMSPTIWMCLFGV
jgi:hypothetical protein